LFFGLETRSESRSVKSTSPGARGGAWCACSLSQSISARKDERASKTRRQVRSAWVLTGRNSSSRTMRCRRRATAETRTTGKMRGRKGWVCAGWAVSGKERSAVPAESAEERAASREAGKRGLERERRVASVPVRAPLWEPSCSHGSPPRADGAACPLAGLGGLPTAHASACELGATARAPPPGLPSGEVRPGNARRQCPERADASTGTAEKER
jgi:hypothetical protein